jgi:hypothetical protein
MPFTSLTRSRSDSPKLDDTNWASQLQKLIRIYKITWILFTGKDIIERIGYFNRIPIILSLGHSIRASLPNKVLLKGKRELLRDHGRFSVI